MLRDSIFYILMNNKEKAGIYTVITYNFKNIRHWYYCKNKHFFTIKKCGMPIKTF